MRVVLSEVSHLLGFPFVGPLALMVDPGKVGHDDRHRQRDDEHSTQGAHATHNLARDRVRHHVTVPARQTRAHNS